MVARWTAQLWRQQIDVRLDSARRTSVAVSGGRVFGPWGIAGIAGLGLGVSAAVKRWLDEGLDVARRVKQRIEDLQRDQRIDQRV